MAETGRNRLATALLVVAAPLLVLGGLSLTTSGPDGPRPGPSADQPAPAGSSVVRPPAPADAHGGNTDTRGVRPSIVVLPSLDVQAHVRPIATRGGALTPPPDPRDVGWWSGGARPGARRGAAVLAGHTVHTGGGAFDDLDDLDEGDRVIVRSARRTVAYEVASVRVLSRAQLARRHRTIFARSGPGRLVLITCEDWDGAAYLSNVVVTARPATA
ncbi:class F sortase [Nocardioides KLBMP 9356]|uniref:Class F sortase n=1 Tax=Nocardioides potassii TaxID=2911371 RepID=A0ABS9HBB0_9ACTN|nr:class F sortase [Nocardioides potassii]MCF6378497.1 class F sortase [Nocardioides potassii]